MIFHGFIWAYPPASHHHELSAQEVGLSSTPLCSGPPSYLSAQQAIRTSHFGGYTSHPLRKKKEPYLELF